MWALSKALGAPVADPLAEAPDLLLEWEIYAAAEAEEHNRQAERERLAEARRARARSRGR